MNHPAMRPIALFVPCLTQTGSRLICILWFGILMVASRAHATSLPPCFVQALDQANIPLAHVGLIVWPLDQREPSVTLNAEQPFNPASTLKLVTSYAALNLLGPAYTWQTEVLTDGELHGGILNGNLYLRGNGDPGLTDERFYLLLRQLRILGLQRINGDLIIDQSAFQSMPEAVFDDHPWRAYNARPAATLFDFASTEIQIGSDANHLLLHAEPLPPGAQLDNRITLDDLPCDTDWRDRIHADWQAQADTLMLSGHYSVQCQTKQFGITENDPSALIANAFLAFWPAQGGSFSGRWRTGITPTDARPILSFASRPLTQALYSMNKYSNNVMARNLFLSLSSARPASEQSAGNTVLDWLHGQGLNFPELVMDNGAGLSRTARISALSMARLLRHAAADPLYAELTASLPILAVDGTLKHRDLDQPVAAHAHLKSGTLNGVKTLAGYVTQPDGRIVVVVLFINDAQASAGTAAQDALLDWVYRTK